MLDILIQKVTYPNSHGIRQEHFHNLLRSPGAIHRNSRPEPEEKNRGQNADGQRRGHEVRNRMLWIVRNHMDRT